MHVCERKYTHTHLGCINTQRLVFKHEKRARLGFQARNPLSKFISVPSSFGNSVRTGLPTRERPGPWGLAWELGRAGWHPQPPPRAQNHCKQREGGRRKRNREDSQVTGAEDTSETPREAPFQGLGGRPQARHRHHGSGNRAMATLQTQTRPMTGREASSQRATDTYTALLASTHNLAWAPQEPQKQHIAGFTDPWKHLPPVKAGSVPPTGIFRQTQCLKGTSSVCYHNTSVQQPVQPASH